MLTKKEINNFLYRENEQKLKETKELYAMSKEQRIQKRKCIDNLRYEVNYHDEECRGNVMKFNFDVNLSDFKVGDYIILSFDNPNSPFANGPIIEISNNYLIFSAYKYDYSKIRKEGITADIDSFDSTEINKSFLVESNEKKLKKWLKVINEIPQIEYNEIESLNEDIEIVAQKLGVKLTASQKEAIYRAIANKEYYLIQGPPGTGKTFVISIIAFLLRQYGNNVLISSSNHLAINNVLCKLHKTTAIVFDRNPEETKEEDEKYNSLNLPIFKIGQYYNTIGLDYIWKNDKIRPYNFERPNIYYINNNEEMPRHIIGIIPYHLFTNRANGLKGDVLIIDEAGQVTIPTALMAMQAVDYVILVGDHKQLAPIFSYKNHPANIQQSVFQALYREYNCTTLDITYRMNEDICSLVSTSFYQGKLTSEGKSSIKYKDNEQNPILNASSVIFKNIQHNGECSSVEEAEFITDSIKLLIEEEICSSNEIAILSPFRAQCALIRRKLKKVFDDIPIVDTIDRMQGQEREIIFLSFTAGNKEYTEELSDFLYNPNKINVAVSRAKSKLILVGNKDCIIKNIVGKKEFEEVYRLITSTIIVNY